MLGVAGWIGALFLLGFVGVGLAFVFRSEASALFVGALVAPPRTPVRQGRLQRARASPALAVSFAGQAMFIYGLHEGLVGSQSPTFCACRRVRGRACLPVRQFHPSSVVGIRGRDGLRLRAEHARLYGVGTALMARRSPLSGSRKNWAARGGFWRDCGDLRSRSSADLALDDIGRWMRPSIRLSNPVIVWIVNPCSGRADFVVYKILKVRRRISSTTGVSSLRLCRHRRSDPPAPGITSSSSSFCSDSPAGAARCSASIVAMIRTFALYYSLQLTLLMKSMALAGTGVALIAMGRHARPVSGGSGRPRVRRFEGSRCRHLIALAGVLILIVANVGSTRNSTCSIQAGWCCSNSRRWIHDRSCRATTWRFDSESPPMRFQAWIETRFRTGAWC